MTSERDDVQSVEKIGGAIIAFCVILLAGPLAAQETADPALELYYSANAAYNRKLYTIAITNYTDFLKRYSTHAKAQMARRGLGLSRFALKQYDLAVPEFDKLLSERNLDPKIDRAQVTLLHAQSLLYTNQKDEAQKRLIAAASSLPAGVYRTGATAAVTDLFFDQKDWPNTVIWARKLQDIPSANSGQIIRAGYQEGFARYKLEQITEALVVLEKIKALAANERSEAWGVRIRYLISECHVSKTTLDEAENALQTALAGMTGTAAVNAQYRLAAIKFSREKWEDAKADYDAFLKGTKTKEEEDPRIREAKLRIARCWMELGDTSNTDKLFDALITVNDEFAARATLWRGRLYSRNEELGDRYKTAADRLKLSFEQDWYKKGIPNKAGQAPQALVADIDFEYANARMLQNQPDWTDAYNYLNRIRQRRRDYPQMPDVIHQQAICQHKLKVFNTSLALTTEFMRTYPSDKLMGDIRFLHAENMFLLNRFDEALTSYNDFLRSHKEHAKEMAANFRIAQIYHHQQKWEESNKRAVPLLDKKPEGELFAQLSFVVGENYFRLGKWAEAVEPFKGFLATYYGQPPSEEDPNHLVQGPNVDAALVQLAVSCAHLDEKEEAIKHLDMFIRAYTRRGTVATTHLPLALAEQGKLYYEIGELDKAKSPLNQFVQYRQENTRPPFQKATSEVGRVHYYLGWVDATQDRHAEAAENFKLAAANSHGRIGKDGIPLLEDAVLQQGIALVNAKDFENAAKHLQDVVNRYREHSRKALLTYYAGLAYARIEKWNEAAAFFKRLIAELPEAPFADKAVYEWAWCERSLEKDEAATAQYQFLIEKYPKSELLIKVQSELAELNLDAGAQDEVIAKLTETLAKVTDPNMKFEIEYQIASAYFKKKDYETSAVKFEALIPGGEQSKLLGSIRFQAGEARLALTETVPAREHFYSALQAPGVPKPLVESILMRLGETQNITGQYAEAQKTYERFLREFPESQWVRNARYGYAFALEKQENYPSAIGEYSKLLPAAEDDPMKMDKWMVQGRYQIGECYFNTKDYDKAMAIFVSVDTNSQGYPEWQAKAVLEMSRILMVQDKRPDAMERLKEVMRRFPKTKAAAVAQKYLDELRFGS